jgi:hypothetical protein
MSYACCLVALLLIAAAPVLPSLLLLLLLLLLPLQFAALPLHTALTAATANVYNCKRMIITHT